MEYKKYPKNSLNKSPNKKNPKNQYKKMKMNSTQALKLFPPKAQKV